MSDEIIGVSGFLKTLRKDKGWRLQDVAERTGLSVSYLSDIERGRTNPSMATAVKIANAFDMDLAELYGGAAQGLTAGEHQLLEAWRSGDWARLLQMVSARIAEAKGE